MTDKAKEILELIENVDPKNTNDLDSIDKEVVNEFWPELAAYNFEMGYSNPQYTRSRDALKSIRPSGWHSFAAKCDGNHESNKHMTGYAGVAIYEDRKTSKDTMLDCDPFPTEELAELHAIIQAIAYERKNQ